MTIRFHIYLLFIFIIATSSCNNPSKKKDRNKKQASVKIDTLPLQKADTIITIAAVGDIMLGTAYPNAATLPPDSGTNSLRYAINDLKDADLTFGNLEGVLLDKGEPAAMKLKFRSKPYLFKMPESYGGILKNAGFDILSVANNHSNDFGYLGRERTMRVLDSLGIYYAGLKTSPVTTFARNGIKYGFCAFSPNSQTVSLLDIPGAVKTITTLKQTNDIVLVSFHGGGEGVDFEHVPDSAQSFNGERRGNVKAFAHAAINAGADLVIGHGPHVSRAVELYKGKLIAYSLGNFCTYRSVSVAGVCGLAPMMKLRLTKNGRFLDGQIISFKQSHEFGLRRDTLNKASKRIKFLTETDFSNPGISISESGAITATE
ncbi:CapA family protein [Mucilaginibacter terrenus]|uniref:CapA family protein n=1 Tax=Mucilaginibacter terrenus TaxID=2482727 RepID=A0A3E2NJU3_9SPHI|nr:CapA family protein [Mucilaginibacter terrenus]RFZ81259.1 CapA family protein [Mucilaginibacter terrenus]